jgi:hypothetical protein
MSFKKVLDRVQARMVDLRSWTGPVCDGMVWRFEPLLGVYRRYNCFGRNGFYFVGKGGCVS